MISITTQRDYLAEQYVSWKTIFFTRLILRRIDKNYVLLYFKFAATSHKFSPIHKLRISSPANFYS